MKKYNNIFVWSRFAIIIMIFFFGFTNFAQAGHSGGSYTARGSAGASVTTPVGTFNINVTLYCDDGCSSHSASLWSVPYQYASTAYVGTHQYRSDCANAYYVVSVSFTQPPPVDGQCGSFNGTTQTSWAAGLNSPQWCSVGSVDGIAANSSNSGWVWNCGGLYGGVTAQCSATLSGTGDLGGGGTGGGSSSTSADNSSKCPGLGYTCASEANICGNTNSGSIACNSSGIPICTATTPANPPLCQPSGVSYGNVSIKDFYTNPKTINPASSNIAGSGVCKFYWDFNAYDASSTCSLTDSAGSTTKTFNPGDTNPPLSTYNTSGTNSELNYKLSCTEKDNPNATTSKAYATCYMNQSYSETGK